MAWGLVNARLGLFARLTGAAIRARQEAVPSAPLPMDERKPSVECYSRSPHSACGGVRSLTDLRCGVRVWGSDPGVQTSQAALPFACSFHAPPAGRFRLRRSGHRPHASLWRPSPGRRQCLLHFYLYMSANPRLSVTAARLIAPAALFARLPIYAAALSFEALTRAFKRRRLHCRLPARFTPRLRGAFACGEAATGRTLPSGAQAPAGGSASCTSIFSALIA